MDNEDLNSWYLIQCKPNKNKLAINNLNRQGFETFYPTFEITRRIKSKFINKVIPLFPGYIFVLFNVNDSKWLKIKSTFGVTRIVSFGSLPMKVPSNLIFDLKQRSNNLEIIELNKKIKEGDEVKIIKGPFSGFIGKIQKVDAENRLHILFDFMKKANCVSFDSKDILSTN